MERRAAEPDQDQLESAGPLWLWKDSGWAWRACNLQALVHGSQQTSEAINQARQLQCSLAGYLLMTALLWLSLCSNIKGTGSAEREE